METLFPSSFVLVFFFSFLGENLRVLGLVRGRKRKDAAKMAREEAALHSILLLTYGFCTTQPRFALLRGAGEGGERTNAAFVWNVGMLQFSDGISMQ